MSKKNPAPVLTCVISGTSRKTSHNYLASKAKRLGVSSEWLLNNYVSKYICSQLRAGRSVTDLIDNRNDKSCLLYTSPSPRDATLSRMPSSA